MKKAVLPGLLIVSLLLGGCRTGGDAPETEVPEKITPVEVTQLSTGSIERNLIYTGQVKPVEQVTVVPKIGGKVTAVNYNVGDRVNADDILFTIDDTDINNSISVAQAQYNAALTGIGTAEAALDSVSGAQADSQILQLDTAVKNAEMAVSNAEIGVQNSKLALDNATQSYDNAKVLFGAGTMSKTDYDRIELGYNQALSAYEKATNDKSQAETGLSQAQESRDLYVNKTMGSAIRQAQSSVSQAAASAGTAMASLSNAERSLDDLNVKSPISGVISAKNISVGVMVGQTVPAYTVIDMDTVEVNTNVSEELINTIFQGMTVQVYIRTISEEPFEGVISTISPAAEDVKNTYPVKIAIPNPDGLLKPGMFAEAKFVKERNDDTVILPRNAVQDEEESKYVFVAEDGTAKKYFVETGIDNGIDIEIISELPQDALVITKGQTLIADGEKIKIVSQ